MTPSSRHSTTTLAEPQSNAMPTNAQHPRTGNYGGATYNLILDYLRGTLPHYPGWRRDLRAWLGEATPRERGWRRWYDRSAHVLGTGLLGWCSSAKRAATQGIVIDLPATALAQLGADAIPFYRWLTTTGHITRIDVALDDHAGQLTLTRLRKALADDRIITRWRKRPNFVGDLQMRESEGWTLYFGARKSDSMLRIYNKAAKESRPADSPWIRIEWEVKHDLAHSLSRAYLDRGPHAIIAQLRRRIRIVAAADSHGDNNRWRWPLAPWWELLIGATPADWTLTCPQHSDAMLQALQSWWAATCAPAAKAIIAAQGGDTTWILETIAAAKITNDKHRAIVAAANTTMTGRKSCTTIKT